MDVNILITGAGGYIGSILVDTLFDEIKPLNIMAYDNLMYKQTSLLSYMNRKNFWFEYGDVRNHSHLKKSMKKADIIIPLAAIVGMPACEKHADLATAVNYGHVKLIMKEKSSDQLVLYPNTNSGYGLGQGDVYCTEKSPLKPISHYGKTKCDAEKAVLDGGGISFRLATVFGISPRMRLDLLVNDFVYKALTDGYLCLFEKHFKRNFIHVRDVAKAFAFMIENQQYGIKGQAFNVGLSSANISKLQLAERIKEYLPKLSILSDDIREDPDKRNYIVSNEKIETLGWRPDYSLDDGIKELIKAYKVLYGKLQHFTNL